MRALGILVLLLVAVLLGWGLWRMRAAAPPPLLVEVAGEVAQAGLHELPVGATPRDALTAAVPRVPVGADPFLDLPLRDGYRVELGPDGSLRVCLAGERLLAGLPVDLNLASRELLEQLPGVGPSLAGAIVADREARGPFPTVDALTRVAGIGPATLAELRPFLEVGEFVPHPSPAPPAPLDLNRADAAALESLPGIGPVLAASIVADREAHGSFHSLQDLERVKGIGPRAVERLAGRVVVGPTEEDGRSP
jgi:competence protein ComEA